MPPPIFSRHRVPAGHIIIGDGYRLLDDDEVIEEGDEEALLSCLLSLDYHLGWRAVCPHAVGQTVAKECTWDAPNIDAWDRLFRRRKCSVSVPVTVKRNPTVSKETAAAIVGHPAPTTPEACTTTSCVCLTAPDGTCVATFHVDADGDACLCLKVDGVMKHTKLADLVKLLGNVT